jgi:hypothetical protein
MDKSDVAHPPARITILSKGGVFLDNQSNNNFLRLKQQ